MYLIVGLGNPEAEYTMTRHNMGFDVINKLSFNYKIDITKNKFDGMYGQGLINNEKIILLKPLTYMNLSGCCIKKFVDFYKILYDKLIVIYDDMDIDIGKIKVKKNGGAGSHNGMKSVVYELGSKDFCRIRVGIGRPINNYDAINYVIGKMGNNEYNELEAGINLAVQAANDCILHRN